MCMLLITVATKLHVYATVREWRDLDVVHVDGGRELSYLLLASSQKCIHLGSHHCALSLATHCSGSSGFLCLPSCCSILHSYMYRHLLYSVGLLTGVSVAILLLYSKIARHLVQRDLRGLETLGPLHNVSLHSGIT